MVELSAASCLPCPLAPTGISRGFLYGQFLLLPERPAQISPWGAFPSPPPSASIASSLHSLCNGRFPPSSLSWQSLSIMPSTQWMRKEGAPCCGDSNGRGQDGPRLRAVLEIPLFRRTVCAEGFCLILYAARSKTPKLSSLIEKKNQGAWQEKNDKVGQFLTQSPPILYERTRFQFDEVIHQ